MIKKLALGIVSLGVMTSIAMATTYTGNGATGFGGTLGNGSLTLTQSGTTINGSFTEGAAFSDGFVIYIDSTLTGANATQISTAAGFTDSADTNRGAITERGTNTVNLPIAADFAIALSPVQGSFGGLWSLSNGANLPFVTSVNLLPLNATGPYTFSFDLSNIGLTPGQSFNFVTTYVNGSNGFLSNETLSPTTGLGATNPGNGATVTLVGFQTFTSTAVPEPGTIMSFLSGSSLLGGLMFIRRRRS
jgi:hypothetical protein